MFSSSPIVIFADNDRHLESKGGNLGVLKAMEALKCLGCTSALAAPDFCDYGPSKEVSDWNDLARLKGRQEALSQISKFL
jgi:phage/plasmid primase-like uncharacterized protein